MCRLVLGQAVPSMCRIGLVGSECCGGTRDLRILSNLHPDPAAVFCAPGPELAGPLISRSYCATQQNMSHFRKQVELG